MAASRSLGLPRRNDPGREPFLHGFQMINVRELRMRSLVLAALPLALVFTVAPHQARAEQTAAVSQQEAAQIDEWSARRHTTRHRYTYNRHYVRYAHAKRHHVRSARSYKSRGFAWYFANEARLNQGGSCMGNRVTATWYQSGSRTASGAPFNPNGMTAAHRTLPFGSRVTVTNPRNGQSATVTINDRGPFTRGVSIDLARGAARAIGMTGTQQICMS